MRKDQDTRGFTLIELLVVVAIIALLISILLPSLSQAREQGKKAVCLSHIKSIGQASQAYAADDRREQLIPLAMVSVRQEGHSGIGNGSPYYFERLCDPAAFGGRTPVKDLVGLPDQKAMRAVGDGGNGYWEAHRRPLNKYVYGEVDAADAKKLEMFHCPSDTGYPQCPSVISEGDYYCPKQSWQVPLYDVLGNSYRYNICGLFWIGAGVSLNTGALGHTSSAVESPSRVAMFCEPLWYLITLLDTANNPAIAAAPLEGWHKKLVSDNVGYCDGSGRLTRADQKIAFDQVTMDAMGCSPCVSSSLLRRGKTWQTDCYPSPGAVIKQWTFSGQEPQLPASPFTTKSCLGWPVTNYTVNENPDY